jgi:periplasmic mercuric ion binding protein
MNLIERSCVAVVAILLATAGVAAAESKVVVSGVHLCCGGCVTGAQEAVEGLAGVKIECSMKEKSIIITAGDDAAAQKAIDALADSGFHGKVDSKTVAFKPVATPEGKVKRLEVSGVHNCCGACNKAIKGAIKTVDGVTGDTATSKSDSFVVEGDFSASQLVSALLGAGFHVSVKK